MEKPPRCLETDFRNALGEVSPYFSLVDIATKELLKKNDRDALIVLSKKHDYKRLSLDNSILEKAHSFVYLSYLAFIHSKSEKFLEDFIKYEKKLYSDASSDNFDGLDTLRRAISRLHRQKTSRLITTNDDKTYAQYAGDIELKIIDYYRKIRNCTLHGNTSEANEFETLSEKHLEKIKEKYGYSPRKVSELTIKDVILYSKAWQSVAVSLCRKLVDIDSIVEKLCRAYAGHKPSRRDNAISKKLLNDYLQDQQEINRLRQQTNDWLA